MSLDLQKLKDIIAEKASGHFSWNSYDMFVIFENPPPIHLSDSLQLHLFNNNNLSSHHGQPYQLNDNHQFSTPDGNSQGSTCNERFGNPHDSIDDTSCLGSDEPPTPQHSTFGEPTVTNLLHQEISYDLKPSNNNWRGIKSSSSDHNDKAIETSDDKENYTDQEIEFNSSDDNDEAFESNNDEESYNDERSELSGNDYNYKPSEFIGTDHKDEAIKSSDNKENHQSIKSSSNDYISITILQHTIPDPTSNSSQDNLSNPPFPPADINQPLHPDSPILPNDLKMFDEYYPPLFAPHPNNNPKESIYLQNTSCMPEDDNSTHKIKFKELLFQNSSQCEQLNFEYLDEFREFFLFPRKEHKSYEA
ncbi:hypothetical protein FQN51_004329 [Onygenales sp. PD_10]|nr:hypothetical protein FQN51_004329 [Onygenales sp. PD_10]